MQEAVNNAAKYSRAEMVSISLCKKEDCIELIIRDNGKGFDLDAVLTKKHAERGLGLTSMRERTDLSGGIFALESAPGAGTLVRAHWPLTS